MGKTKPKPSKNGSAPAEPPKACYVLSLEIENVRCFGPKQTLDLSDGNSRPAQWTIILGENGVGKTTLLQVLTVVELLPNLLLPTTLSGLLVPPFDVTVPFPHFFLRDNPSGVTAACSVKGVQASKLSGPPEFEVIANWNSNGGDKTQFGGTGFSRTGLRFYGYGAGRRLSGNAGSHYGLDVPCATLFDSNASLRNAEDWLLQLDYVASKKWDASDTASYRRELAKDLLIGIMPDGEVSDIRFIPGEGVYPRPRVEFETPYGWVPLRRLGYGYQTLIAWVTDLVSRMAERYPDSADPLKEPAIVVVDEIDLHLHPTWQRKLIGFLTERFPNTQFIATAHSPLVVQAAANANLAVLKRVGDHVEIHNDVDQIRGWRIDQILTSELFGLKSARPPEVERLFERKQQLLAKRKLTAEEKAELAQVNAEVEKVPTGETAQQAAEMEAIRNALDLLQKKSPG